MNIKKIRQDSGLTQLEFSKELGISRASLSAFETGRNKIPLYIEKLLEAKFIGGENKLIAKRLIKLNKENKILKEKIKYLEKKFEILENSSKV